MVSSKLLFLAVIAAVQAIDVDVAVVGGGGSGGYAAVQLRENYGKKIVVIEKQKQLVRRIHNLLMEERLTYRRAATHSLGTIQSRERCTTMASTPSRISPSQLTSSNNSKFPLGQSSLNKYEICTSTSKMAKQSTSRLHPRKRPLMLWEIIVTSGSSTP